VLAKAGKLRLDAMPLSGVWRTGLIVELEEGTMAKERSDAPADTVTYFFLITHKDGGAHQVPDVKDRHVAEITSAVREEGGTCTLYLTKGAAYDYLSVMTGLSAAAAIRIANFIESRGPVKTKVLPGIEQLLKAD
jgi:uncharacterized protein with GYD domain